VIAGVDVVWPLLETERLGTQTIGHTLLGLMFGCFIFSAAAACPQSLFARGLSLRCLTLPGQFSYAMYVMHRPIYKLLLKLNWSVLPEVVQPIAILVATLLATIGVAALSWKFFERPFLALKEWFPRPGEERAPHQTDLPIGGNVVMAGPPAR
jgi:peptidoglycan/LPS O-acetylase OafA/YrhL